MHTLSHQGNGPSRGELENQEIKDVNQVLVHAAAAAKSLQSCPTLCDPIEGSPPGFPVPGILQARTLEWVAISFSNAWKRKVKVKSLSCVQLERPHGLQPTRLLRPWDFLGKSTGVRCHCLLQFLCIASTELCLNEHVSWQNSVSLCPASFCTTRPNLPVTSGITWLPTFAFQSLMMKRESFFFFFLH